jgi:ubiquinone/menaquinone biosynthesis C-methylase UbiE
METMSSYLRLIQKTGATRHPGGFLATDNLLTRTNLTEHSRLLDVGCGAGHTSAYIAKNYPGLVSGIDISESALLLAKSFYRHEPFFNRMSFEQADANNLPFADGYFDVVLCESVLFFIADKKAALKEMIRVLRPGGFLALNEISISAEAGTDSIHDYFLRPEFGGYLSKVDEIIDYIADDFTLLINDEHPFDVKEHFVSELKHWINPRGFLQILELLHQAFINKEARSDLIKVMKFMMDMPKKTLEHLNFLLLLAKKK